MGTLCSGILMYMPERTDVLNSILEYEIETGRLLKWTFVSVMERW